MKSRTLGSAPVGLWSELVRADGADVTFVCQAGYHIYESISALKELWRNGLEGRIVVPERGRGPVAPLRAAWHRGKEIDDVALSAGFERGRIMTSRELLACSKTLVVFNDWGVAADLVQSAKKRRITVVGWVEGVQDLANSDAQRTVFPYQSCDVVFDIFKGRSHLFPISDVYEIGSQRLHSLVPTTAEAPQSYEYDSMINLNFSYGIHTGAKKMWAREVVSAVQSLNLSYAISRHPADRQRLGYMWKSVGGSSEILPKSRRLITRYGTAILDAAVMQKPVVYFNPHGEKLLDSALFEFVHISLKVESLVDNLREKVEPKATYSSVLSLLILDQRDSPSVRASQELSKI